MKPLALGLAPLLLSGAPAIDRCLALSGLSTPALRIDTHQEGPFCRVTMIARPRPSARIGIELWLPPPERWSGRYYQMGNGGFAGHIDVDTLKAAALRGDAAASTDTGHQGNGFEARWATGRPDLVEDYSYRSIKVTADAARGVIRAFYGLPPRRRYFMGCSFGGRQALVAATRWPADWDGVIAGAPALHWIERMQGFARIQRALLVPGAAIPIDRLPALIAAAHARCTRGSAPGCGVLAAEYGCRRGRAALCLAPPQRRALATIEAAGYSLADADPSGWQQWIIQPDPTTGSQLALAEQGFRYLVGAGEGWNPTTGSLDVPAAIRKTFAVSNLRAFAAHGGRVISYFGLSDPVLPPAFARRDAKSVGARMSSYRLFLIPGMAHCQGGPSAATFGQSIVAPSLSDDQTHDVRSALENWVERDAAPGTIIAGIRAESNGQAKGSLTVAPQILLF